MTDDEKIRAFLNNANPEQLEAFARALLEALRAEKLRAAHWPEDDRSDPLARSGKVVA